MGFFKRKELKKLDEVTIMIKDPKLNQEYAVVYTVHINSVNAVIITITNINCLFFCNLKELVMDKKASSKLRKHFYNTIYNSIVHCKGSQI